MKSLDAGASGDSTSQHDQQEALIQIDPLRYMCIPSPASPPDLTPHLRSSYQQHPVFEGETTQPVFQSPMMPHPAMVSGDSIPTQRDHREGIVQVDPCTY